MTGPVEHLWFERLRPQVKLFMFVGGMTGRQWNGLLLASLTLFSAVPVGVLVFDMVFIVPKINAMYQDAGMAIPRYFQTGIQTGEILLKYWYLWLMLLGLWVWQFEHRCVSEQKQSIRNLLFSGLGLVSMVVACWVVGVTLAATLELLLILIVKNA